MKKSLLILLFLTHPLASLLASEVPATAEDFGTWLVEARENLELDYKINQALTEHFIFFSTPVSEDFQAVALKFIQENAKDVEAEFLEEGFMLRLAHDGRQHSWHEMVIIFEQYNTKLMDGGMMADESL